MELSKENKPRWYFYLVWVVAHIIALIIAWFLALGITLLIVSLVGDPIQVGGQERITEDVLSFSILLGMYSLLPVIGLVMGALQYFLLRRYLPHMGWWIAATVAGWLMLFVLFRLLIALLGGDNSVGSLMLGLLLIGVTIALPQWWMLRPRVAHAFWWIILIPVSLAAGGLLRFVTSDPATVVGFAVLYPLATAVTCWLMGSAVLYPLATAVTSWLMSFAVLYPLATAVACWLMLRKPATTGDPAPLVLGRNGNHTPM